MNGFSTTDSEEYEVWLENAEALLEEIPIGIEVLGEKVFFEEINDLSVVRWNGAIIVEAESAEALLLGMEEYLNKIYKDDDGNIRSSVVYLVFHKLFGSEN